jgi:tetratricopeptide (TPR) repeat protein
MADCGAAGTTIDRTARALLGSGQGQEAAKHVGTLMGHASMANQSVMPMVAPEHMTMPSAPMHTLQSQPMATPPSMAAQVASPNMHIAWQASQAANQMNSQMIHHQPHPQQMMHPSAMNHHYQQQQAMQAAMFQHQQQIMQQQQIQMMTAQRASQKTADAVPVERNVENVDDGQMHDEFENWHEGLEEEAQRLQEDAVFSDDGIPQGATMEDLAAAWAQAEAEYEQSGDFSEDPSNLWQGEVEDVPQPYEFVNTETPSEMPNWMEEGTKHFNDGNLKEAIRSFEMELQHNNPDNSAAWRMLGRCHAENDQDPEAIKCLEAAVDRDPYSPESLLALGVSYVNELNHERALSNMKAWFTHNPKYAGMEMPPDIYGATSSNHESAFEEVKKLLLSALAFDSTDAGDIHEALGVIYNVIRDYDSAADSFHKALELRPDDYQLWNKLGAVSVSFRVVRVLSNLVSL